MGSYVNGIYLPASGEVSWEHEVNANLSRLADLSVNVKAYGAVGNGVTDDTAAIQAAINSLDSGSAIKGIVYFQKCNYKISDPIVIGNGSKVVTLILKGHEVFTASNGITDGVVLKPTNNNEDAIQYNAQASVVSSLEIEGVNVQYASVGTGTAFNFAAGSQTTGPIVNDCIADKAGVGFRIGYSVNAKMTDC